MGSVSFSPYVVRAKRSDTVLQDVTIDDLTPAAMEHSLTALRAAKPDDFKQLCTIASEHFRRDLKTYIQSVEKRDTHETAKNPMHAMFDKFFRSEMLSLSKKNMFIKPSFLHLFASQYYATLFGGDSNIYKFEKTYAINLTYNLMIKYLPQNQTYRASVIDDFDKKHVKRTGRHLPQPPASRARRASNHRGLRQ